MLYNPELFLNACDLQKRLVLYLPKSSISISLSPSPFRVVASLREIFFI